MLKVKQEKVLKIPYLPTSDWVTLKNNSTWVLTASSSIVSGALSSNFDEDSKVIPVWMLVICSRTLASRDLNWVIILATLCVISPIRPIFSFKTSNRPPTSSSSGSGYFIKGNWLQNHWKIWNLLLLFLFYYEFLKSPMNQNLMWESVVPFLK